MKTTDLTVDAFRHPDAANDVSRTSTAARITHSSGIQVSCWIHKSYSQNRDLCFKMLENAINTETQASE